MPSTLHNTLILVDKRGVAWKKVGVKLYWKHGGFQKFSVDDKGIGIFSGKGRIVKIEVAGETILHSVEVKGSTTFTVMSEKSH